MRSLLLTTLVLAGSALATSSCAELPPESGCYYSAFDGELLGNSAPGCPAEPSGFWWGWWSAGRPSGTTTTLAAPVVPEPVPPIPEPVGSAPASSDPVGSSTTTTTTISMAPVAFTATGTCSASPLGVVLSGHGTPGSLVTVTAADPYQWYYAQPSPPATVAAVGTWQITMAAETPSWLPATFTLAASTGGSTVVSVASC